MSRGKQASGFTLIELMITIAVLAVCLAIAFPSFQQTLRSNKVATSTNALVGSLALARSEAIRSKHASEVCPSQDGASCAGTWSDGYLVWTDLDADSALSDGEAVKFNHGDGAVALSGPGTPISFDARGRPNSATSLTLKASTCGAHKQLQRKIDISVTGQVTTTVQDCP